MFTNQELLELWGNDQKRRTFVNDYKTWGVWFVQPELDLTFYKFDLPGGDRLIALEYLRKPYPGESDRDSVVRSRFYLQQGKYFEPSAVSESVIAGRLMELKQSLNRDQKQRDMECRRCGSRCFQYKPDGTVLCTACMAMM